MKAHEAEALVRIINERWSQFLRSPTQLINTVTFYQNYTSSFTRGDFVSNTDDHDRDMYVQERGSGLQTYFLMMPLSFGSQDHIIHIFT